MLIRPRSVVSTVQAAITHGSQLTSSNTGIPAGTSLAAQSATGGTVPGGTWTDTVFTPTGASFCTIGASGGTYTRCRFTGGLLIALADDVTLSRCDMPGGMSISSSYRTSMTRCRVHTTSGDLMQVTGDQGGRNQCLDVTLTECLIDNAITLPGDHADGLQVRGSLRLKLIRCRLDMGLQVAGNYKNSALFPQGGANGGNADLEVRDCYLNGGGYIQYLDPISGTSTFIGNRFGPDFTFGRILNATAFVPTTWTGNVVHATSEPVDYLTGSVAQAS